MADACAKCGVPLPKLDRGPPQRLCSKCRAPTLMGVAAPELVKQLAQIRSQKQASPVPATGASPSPPPEPPGDAARDDDPERSSVLTDLRAITAQATAQVAPTTDEPELMPVEPEEAPAVPDDDAFRPPPAEAPPVAPPPPPRPAPTTVEAPLAPPPSAVHDQCPRCGFALPPRSVDAPSTALAWLPTRVRAVVTHPRVRTFLPWTIAACAVLVAIFATWRASSRSSDPSAASPSTEGAEPSADEPTARPPPRVPPPGLGPRPKPAPAKSAPTKTTPKPG